MKASRDSQITGCTFSFYITSARRTLKKKISDGGSTNLPASQTLQTFCGRVLRPAATQATENRITAC